MGSRSSGRRYAGRVTPRETFARLDRALGRRMRAGVSSEGARRARLVSGGMAPAFQALVGVMIAVRRTRRTGVILLIAAVTAALIALVARDRLDRRRPGPRADGGMPSRHAAAAAAIASALGQRGSMLSPLAWIGVAAGSAARVLAGDHEAGDVLAGAALGTVIGRLMGRAAS